MVDFERLRLMPQASVVTPGQQNDEKQGSEGRQGHVRLSVPGIALGAEERLGVLAEQGSKRGQARACRTGQAPNESKKTSFEPLLSRS
jgi:hypothetical protein